MTDEQLQEMRSRIAELEQSDADFAQSRKTSTNWLTEWGELAHSISELRQTQQAFVEQVLADRVRQTRQSWGSRDADQREPVRSHPSPFLQTDLRSSYQ